MKKWKPIIPIGIFLIATGCSTDFLKGDDYHHANKDQSKWKDMQQTQKELDEAALSINESLKNLSAVNPASRLPTPATEVINPTLAQLVSVDWVGPAEPLIREISEIVHYRLKVMGAPPILPLLVTVDVRDVTAQDLLKDIQLQMGARAELIVFPASGLIELHYLDD